MIKIIYVLFNDGREEFIYGNNVCLSNNEIIICSNYCIHRYKSKFVKSVTSADERDYLDYERNIKENKRK